MSDPFDRLADLGAGIDAPEPSVIRARARGIRKRQRITVASVTGGAMAAVVIVATVALSSGPAERVAGDLADGAPTPAQESLSFSELDDADAGDPSTSGGSTGGSTGAVTSQPSGDATASRIGAAPPSEAGSAALQVTVVVEAGVGTEQVFTLRVCNPGAENVTRTFGSAQRYDFEVFVADGTTGAPSWRWSTGKAFAQVVGEESWGPGACRDGWRATWDGRDDDGRAAAPGRYEVVGTLTSSPSVESSAVGFCQITCT